MPAGPAVELVHHVFRPDGSPQRLRTGEQLPLHASAARQVPARLRADRRAAGRTSSTCSATPGAPSSPSARSRAARDGPAARLGGRAWGSYRTGVGGLAAPVRTGVGSSSARSASRGRSSELFGGGGTPTPRLVEQLLNAAREISGGAGGDAADGTGDRSGGRGDRPGHHLDPVPAVRPGGPDGRGRPARAPAALPALGLGRARRRGDLAQRHPDRPRGAAQRRARARRTSSRWASRTSARRPSSGTGTPVHRSARAITWQDTRTDGLVAGLVGDGRAGWSTERCGLPLATYFAGPRLRWLLDHVPGRGPAQRRGDVLFGTMESWLVWQLTGGRTAAGTSRTSPTPAARCSWTCVRGSGRPGCSTRSACPRRMLPEIRSNSEVYGTCTTVLPGVPGRGGAGRPARRARRAGVLRARARRSARTARARSC